MKNISRFFTLYWIIYFPTCIAYNDLPGFSSVDEIMTIILLLYTFIMYGSKYINKEPWKEFVACLGVIAFYVVYSLLFGANVSGGVWLDLMQEIRPYSIIFCTWILNPQFTKKQKKWMLITMIITLFSWILYHLQTLDSQVEAEFPVLGQLAICTGMSYYLFTKETKRNRLIALFLVLTGMLAPKFKFIGEVVCFISFIFFLKKRLNFRSPKTMIYCVLVVTIVLMVSWTRFDAYYVSGLDNEGLARPMTYKTGLKILWDYFPFGSGMGSFACNGAKVYYSPLYYKYDLNGIWGLGVVGAFICDAYYPSLAQFGIVGVFFFCWFWKRRLAAFNIIADMRYYRVAMVTFCCLAIEQTADSSWLSGKGMGYCMLIALCLNANRNQMMKWKRIHLQLKRRKALEESIGQVDNKGEK
ncbi:uncharacterized protein BN769_00598 [Prevotella sp. CAG:732]|mgnify:FL=1|nr:hypothetical protein [Prevotella sp. CAG:732]CDD20523.1 uncharacterized protein BN769_00598 [Prevotella sp. CAG:732]